MAILRRIYDREHVADMLLRWENEGIPQLSIKPKSGVKSRRNEDWQELPGGDPGRWTHIDEMAYVAGLITGDW